MWWVVLTVILAIAFWIGVGMFLLSRSGSRPMGVAVIGIAVVIEIALTVAFSMARIGTGEAGLVYSFSGKLSETALTSPGIVWKSPWTRIVKVNIQLQREEFDLSESNAAVSKDQQPIFAHLALNFEVDPNHIVSLYRDVGPSWRAKLIDSRVLQDFKEITATYPTIDITAKREALRRQTRERLVGELDRYSITVSDFFVQNIGFSPAYREAIEQKQVQVQAAARAQAKVAQVEAEARQRVAEAQGAANARLTNARAEAKANRLIARSITPTLIDLRRVEALAHANTIYVPANWTAFGNLATK